MNRFDIRTVISYTLIAAGTFAAILAASRTPLHLGLFLPAAAVTISGVVYDRVRRSKKREDTLARQLDARAFPDSVASLMNELRGIARELRDGRDGTLDQNVMKDFDVEFSPLVSQLHAGAEIVCATAESSAKARLKAIISQGERSINRARSALADGYPEEAAHSIAEAIGRFEEVEDVLRRIEDATGHAGGRHRGA